MLAAHQVRDLFVESKCECRSPDALGQVKLARRVLLLLTTLTRPLNTTCNVFLAQ